MNPITRKTSLAIAAAALAAAAMVVTWSMQSSRRAAATTKQQAAESAARQSLLAESSTPTLDGLVLPLAEQPSTSTNVEPSDEDRLVSTAILKASESERFSREDAIVILRGLEPARHLTTQRSAIVAMSGVLKEKPDLDPAIRAQFRAVILACLGSKNKHITSSALAAASESGLSASDPAVQSAMQARTSDPDKRLAVFATRLLEQDRAPKPPPAK